MTTHVAPSKALEPIIPEAVHLVVKQMLVVHIFISLAKKQSKRM